MNKLTELVLQSYKRKARKPIKLYSSSLARKNETMAFLIREGFEKKLIVACKGRKPSLEFELEKKSKTGKIFYYVCRCSHANAKKLRKYFPYTKPILLGLNPAIGMGDRIGLTSSAHLRAAKKFGFIPVIAQQSIREMKATGRSPKEVLDDASWAVFQEGYRKGFAADADHLMKKEDIQATAEAGFSLFTFDPSKLINDEAESYKKGRLEKEFNNLPLKKLKSSRSELLKKYVKEFEISGLLIKFERKDLLQAAVKFSRALVHVKKLFSCLKEICKKFEVEISVDETKKPTSLKEHFFIVSELKRLGIEIRSIAPKFAGKFEKAIDYKGNLTRFENNFKKHLLIANEFGHLLSIHSGSDKFSIYPIVGKAKNFHLKTSGTSYLEAFRVIARNQPKFFRQIASYSRENFQEARKAYPGLVSTTESDIPNPEKVMKEKLEETYLDKKAGRQAMHVTYGFILQNFGEKIKKTLFEHEEEFYETVSSHIEKHLKALT